MKGPVVVLDVHLPSVDDWLVFLGAHGFCPSLFVTLTFDEKRLGAVSVPTAYWWFRRLVDKINRDAMGPRYRRKVKHSFFSYVCVHEYTVRGSVHLHWLTDNWVDCRLIHDYWNLHCGFAWTAPVPNPKISGGLSRLKSESSDAALRYVLKYVLKGSVYPLVWIKHERISIRVVHLDTLAVKSADDFTDYDVRNPPDV